ncbi:MAG: MFS transporter [Candidatus Izemoplasmatales bacterium]|nr:MFS transporter [Candidatus Izemoplasmatales bacterium]
MEQKQMKTREKMLFAWGDVFGGGAQALVGVLYLIFLTDIIGLDPALAALAITVSKIWDAVIDPALGVIGDNTRSKIGRRRPYILAGGIAFILVFALMWLPTNHWESDLWKMVYAITTFVFYTSASSMISVSYSSLSAEITTNLKERNSVNILRLVMSTIATAVCTLLPSMILEMFKKGSVTLTEFYLIIGIGFGLFFALPIILIGFFTKERAPIPSTKSVFDLKSFVKPLKVKAFRGLVYMYLCQSIAMDILSAGIMYYALYVAKGSSTVFLGIFIGVQLLMFPLINALVNKVDKKKIYYFGLPLALVAFIGVGIYPSDWPIIGAYILTGFTALGFAGAQLISWIIFPDAVDVGELRFGYRPTGSFSGIMTFIRQAASAIAIQIFGIMLSVSGYIKATEEVPIPVQPDSAILGIRIAMVGSFVLLMAIGYLVARRFVLTRKKSEQVRRLLALSREIPKAEWDAADQTEFEELKAEIF